MIDRYGTIKKVFLFKITIIPHFFPEMDDHFSIASKQEQLKNKNKNKTNKKQNKTKPEIK